MPSQTSPVRPFADVARALQAAGIRAQVLTDVPGIPHLELLLAPGEGPRADRVLGELDWRWRTGGDGFWRWLGPRRYQWDGGFVVTVHRRLAAAPMPAPVTRPLERMLWDTAGGESPHGLPVASAAAHLVYLALQAARGEPRPSYLLPQAAADSSRVTDWGATWQLARRVGADTALGAILAAAGVATAGPPRRAGAVARVWRGIRLARRLLRRWPAARAIYGDPFGLALTRCRFDGLELLAGPGTFLPRGVSEDLVAVSAELMGTLDPPTAIDVGTGCGAVALALARRVASAEIVGVDIDPTALRWARQNARRLDVRSVRFLAGSLLEPVPVQIRGTVGLVVANVPCVPASAFAGGSDAPVAAYLGEDPDGLGLQRRLAADARAVLRPGGWLAVQLAPDQAAAYARALGELGFDELGAQTGRIAVVFGRWPARRLPARAARPVPGRG